MTVSKITNAPTQKELIDKTNEIIDNLGGGGTSTDVQINGTSITSGGVANILTNSAYDASSNKIATMNDLPSGGANTDLSNLTATGEAHFLKNTSSYNHALGILGAANADSAISIGYGSAAGQHCISLGKNASANGSYAIQIGEGINTTSNSLYFGFENNNYQLLDGSTGLIPDARISTNIQRTATAVTHTENTAVGSSTKPVYISSAGVAIASTSTVGSSTIPVYLNAGNITSTGLSIASSRFDGQWVYKFLSGSSATAVGTVTIDLSSYLPSDSYKYEVLINLCLYSNPSSGGTDVFLWSDVFQNTNTGQDERVARCNTNSRASENRFTMPVGTGRWIKRQIVDKAATVSCNVSFWGYRRIGTNT